MKKYVGYKEPASYFTKEMLEAADKWDKEHSTEKTERNRLKQNSGQTESRADEEDTAEDCGGIQPNILSRAEFDKLLSERNDSTKDSKAEKQ